MSLYFSHLGVVPPNEVGPIGTQSCENSRQNLGSRRVPSNDSADISEPGLGSNLKGSHLSATRSPMLIHQGP